LRSRHQPRPRPGRVRAFCVPSTRPTVPTPRRQRLNLGRRRAQL